MIKRCCVSSIDPWVLQHLRLRPVLYHAREIAAFKKWLVEPIKGENTFSRRQTLKRSTNLLEKEKRFQPGINVHPHKCRCPFQNVGVKILLGRVRRISGRVEDFASLSRVRIGFLDTIKESSRSPVERSLNVVGPTESIERSVASGFDDINLT